MISSKPPVWKLQAIFSPAAEEAAGFADGCILKAAMRIVMESPTCSRVERPTRRDQGVPPLGFYFLEKLHDSRSWGNWAGEDLEALWPPAGFLLGKGQDLLYNGCREVHSKKRTREAPPSPALLGGTLVTCLLFGAIEIRKQLKPGLSPRA